MSEKIKKNVLEIWNYCERIYSAFKNAVKDGPYLNYGQRAAALSFYTFTALIPLFIVFVALISFFPLDLYGIAIALSHLFPQLPFDLHSILHKGIHLLAKGRILYTATSIIFSYYFASNLFLALHRNLSALYVSPEKPHKLLLVRVLAIPIVILMILVIYFGGIGVSLFLKWLLFLPVLSRITSEIIITFFMSMANLFSFLTFFLVLFVIYHFLLPRLKKKGEIRDTLLMTCIVSLFLTFLKDFFTQVITLAGSINAIYATFGGLIFFLLWIFMAYLTIFMSTRALYYLERK